MAGSWQKQVLALAALGLINSAVTSTRMLPHLNTARLAGKWKTWLCLSHWNLLYPLRQSCSVTSYFRTWNGFENTRETQIRKVPTYYSVRYCCHSFIFPDHWILTVRIRVHPGPIPVAVRSKAWVYGRSLTGIVGSNPAGAWMSVSSECRVLSGRGLCDELVHRPEESYRV
jgi:hypothetical protein